MQHKNKGLKKYIVLNIMCLDGAIIAPSNKKTGTILHRFYPVKSGMKVLLRDTPNSRKVFSLQ